MKIGIWKKGIVVEIAGIRILMNFPANLYSLEKKKVWRIEKKGGGTMFPL